MKTMTFDETIAIKLYRELKNDSEIGRAVGKKSDIIASWRKRRNLPSIAPTSMNSMVHFSEALAPKQADEMSRFLKSLTWAGKKAIEAGVKPDVGNFMEQWAKSA